jgi:hypothetical protein
MQPVGVASWIDELCFPAWYFELVRIRVVLMDEHIITREQCVMVHLHGRSCCWWRYVVVVAIEGEERESAAGEVEDSRGHAWCFFLACVYICESN